MLAEFPGYVLTSLGLFVFSLFWFDDEGEVQHLYLVLVPCRTLVHSGQSGRFYWKAKLTMITLFLTMAKFTEVQMTAYNVSNLYFVFSPPIHAFSPSRHLLNNYLMGLCQAEQEENIVRVEVTYRLREREHVVLFFNFFSRDKVSVE